MLFKEAVSKRIVELCNKNNITPNKLAELSANIYIAIVYCSLVILIL